MADIVFVAILIAFFALAALFVRACDWLIGPDVEAPPAPSLGADQERDEELAA